MSAPRPAKAIILAPVYTELNVDLEKMTKNVRNKLLERSLTENDVVRAEVLGKPILFMVAKSRPRGIVRMVHETSVQIVTVPPPYPELLVDLQNLRPHGFKEIDEIVRDSSDDYERIVLLDERLPDLVKFSDLEISTSAFDTSISRKLLLEDDECVFLVFTGDFYQSSPRGSDPESIRKEIGADALFLFTNRKLLVTGRDGKQLFDYVYVLNNFLLDENEKQVVEEKINQFLRAFEKKVAVYPLGYDAIYDLRLTKELEIRFRRRDRLQSWEYTIANVRLGLPEECGISVSTGGLRKGMNVLVRNYPCSKEIEKELIDRRYLLEFPGWLLDKNGKSGYVLNVGLKEIAPKIFLDALRRAPREKEKLMEILLTFSETEKAYLHEIITTKEEFSQLICEKCGAGEFEETTLTYDMPQGTYSLLRCKYCGTQGLI